MGSKLSVFFLKDLGILEGILICWQGLQDLVLNVTRAINKARKTYFQLYTLLFKLPFTTRRESKPNQVVNGSTTAFMLEWLHDCACTWRNLEANAVVKASRGHCVKSLMKIYKNLGCYRRQTYKPPLQFSGLCGAVQRLWFICGSVSRNLKVLYGDAMLVDQSGPPIWRPGINENIWSSLCDESAYFSLMR